MCVCVCALLQGKVKDSNAALLKHWSTAEYLRTSNW